MIKAVLFDLDNTLIDFMRMKRMASEAAVSAMVDYGLQMDEEKALQKLFKMYNDYGFEDQAIFDRFIEEVQGEMDYRILAGAIAAYRKVKSGYLATYPHARYTLIKLRERGLKLGIVSDAPRKQAWLRLAELNLMEFFHTIIAVGGTGKEKPHKMPFELALKKLGMNAEEILFVGDNPERDIHGAKKVGMQTALAEYGQFKKGKEKADFELKDIRDLLGIMKD